MIASCTANGIHDFMSGAMEAVIYDSSWSTVQIPEHVIK
jgi:hypothetical protein